MPSKYPICAPNDVCAALSKAGFEFVTQRGSHRKYSDGSHIVIVPMHRKDLKTGTLKGILEQAGMTIDDFIKHL